MPPAKRKMAVSTSIPAMIKSGTPSTNAKTMPTMPARRATMPANRAYAVVAGTVPYFCQWTAVADRARTRRPKRSCSARRMTWTSFMMARFVEEWRTVRVRWLVFREAS